MLIMAGLDGTGQFKIPAIVFGFVSECLLLGRERIPLLNLWEIDYPLLFIFHTISIRYFEGTCNKEE
jgi:hypothetical protein